MNIRILLALLGLPAASGTVVAAPLVAQVHSRGYFDKSVSNDTSRLTVNVIGDEIQVHRVDPARSAFKSNELHRASGTLRIAGVPFAKSLASPDSNNSVIGFSRSTEMKRHTPVNAGALPLTNHVSASNKVFSVVRDSSAMKKSVPVPDSAMIVPGHPFRKN